MLPVNNKLLDFPTAIEYLVRSLDAIEYSVDTTEVFETKKIINENDTLSMKLLQEKDMIKEYVKKEEIGNLEKHAKRLDGFSKKINANTIMMFSNKITDYVISYLNQIHFLSPPPSFSSLIFSFKKYLLYDVLDVKNLSIVPNTTSNYTTQTIPCFTSDPSSFSQQSNDLLNLFNYVIDNNEYSPSKSKQRQLNDKPESQKTFLNQPLYSFHNSSTPKTSNCQHHSQTTIHDFLIKHNLFPQQSINLGMSQQTLSPSKQPTQNTPQQQINPTINQNPFTLKENQQQISSPIRITPLNTSQPQINPTVSQNLFTLKDNSQQQTSSATNQNPFTPKDNSQQQILSPIGQTPINTSQVTIPKPPLQIKQSAINQVSSTTIMQDNPKQQNKNPNFQGFFNPPQQETTLNQISSLSITSKNKVDLKQEVKEEKIGELKNFGFSPSVQPKQQESKEKNEEKVKKQEGKEEGQEAKKEIEEDVLASLNFINSLCLQPKQQEVKEMRSIQEPIKEGLRCKPETKEEP
ncbi:hypothetical protein QTN25_005911 [Entamoeba marina]